jgi:hypothetical protein
MVTFPPEVAVKFATLLTVVVVTTGEVIKVPLTETFTVVAPDDVHATLPFEGAEDNAAMRTKIVVDAIVPAAPTVTLPPLPLHVELFVETSKPVGAVTVIPAAILVPETVNDWDELAVLEHEEKAVRELVLAVITGPVNVILI